MAQISSDFPAGLHPSTTRMVEQFAQALAAKLRKAEIKYGYSNGWLTQPWEDECRKHLREHLERGDPLDVAAYCAFMWHRKWSTADTMRQERDRQLDTLLRRLVGHEDVAEEIRELVQKY